MRIRLDPREAIIGSALRRAAPVLWNDGGIVCDPNRPARLNDLIVGEILDAPGLGGCRSANWIERLYPGTKSGTVVIAAEPLRKGTFVGVVGNRYAPPYLMGGLQDPVTRRPNGEIRGGTIAESLFAVNCVGFVNTAAADFPRARVRIDGVLVDSLHRPISLRRFRESPSQASFPGHAAESKRILVSGHSSDAGKTYTARALVRGLSSRGYRVTVEKKSGTACCRDWLSCFPESDVEAPPSGSPGSREIDIEGFPARDFVDALGVASDVSIGTRTFVRESVLYTDAFVARRSPDFHVIELADNIAHRPNWRLLRDPSFGARLSALVYCPSPRIESVLHFFSFLRLTLGFRDLPVVLSGPLANEDRFEMVRREARVRCGVPVAPSARPAASGWEPEGTSLIDALLEVLTSGGRRGMGRDPGRYPAAKRTLVAKARGFENDD